MADCKISFLDVSQIDSDVLNEHYSIMDETRKKEADALPSALKRKQKIAADMLCRQMISEKCGIPENEIIFSKNGFGKPFAVNADIRFSISHCESFVVCAVSDNEIGIDIERIRDIRFRAAEKFCTENEINYIGNNLKRFFEIWTLKEAFFKCKGTGLGADIKAVSFAINSEKIFCTESGYELSCSEFGGEYIYSVCISNKEDIHGNN